MPTGGGKTVIFSEIVRQYLKHHKKKALVLTHRIELCKQTSNMLTEFGVTNKVVDSKANLDDQGDYSCFVAMVQYVRRSGQTSAGEEQDVVGFVVGVVVPMHDIGRPTVFAGNAHDTGNCLQGDIHAQIFPVRSCGDAITGAGCINQTWVRSAQVGCANAVFVHRAGSDVARAALCVRALGPLTNDPFIGHVS